MPTNPAAYRAAGPHRFWTVCAAVAALSMSPIGVPAIAQDAGPEPEQVKEPGKVPYAPPLPQEQRLAIEEALSAERALRHIEYLTRYNRPAPSAGLDRAMRYIERELKAAGIEDVETLTYTSDGKKAWWIDPAPPAWTCEAAELWLETPNRQKLADWSTDPIRVAAYSTSCDVTADVVEVTDWTKADLDVRGKLVLTSGDAAIANAKAREAGAVGLLLAPPQTPADEALRAAVSTSSLSPAVEDWPNNLFAFNLNDNEASSIRYWLEQGKPVRVKAAIKNAQTAPSEGTIVSGRIRGGGTTDETVLLIAEVAGPSPGANAASGAGALLSLARSCRELFDSGELPAPSRSIRFLFVPDLHGACAYAKKQPKVLDSVVAVIHLGIVGTNTDEGPGKDRPLQLDDGGWIVPSCVPYLALDYGRYVGESRMVDVAGRNAPLSIRGHSRGALGAQSLFYSGSMPRQMVSLSFFPDAITATSLDTADRLDPTSLKRTMYIVIGATFDIAAKPLWELQRVGSLISAYMVRDLAGGLMCVGPILSEVPGEDLPRVFYRYQHLMVRNLYRHTQTTASLELLATPDVGGGVKAFGAAARETYGALANTAEGVYDWRAMEEKLDTKPLDALRKKEAKLLQKVPSMVWFGPVTEELLRRHAPGVLPVPQGIDVQILFSFIDGKRELLYVWGDHEAVRWIGVPIPPPPINQLTLPIEADLDETLAFLERAEQAGIIRIEPKQPSE